MTDVLSAGMGLPDVVQFGGGASVCKCVRSCEVGTNWSQVQMSKHINYIIVWVTSDVLFTGLGCQIY